MSQGRAYTAVGQVASWTLAGDIVAIECASDAYVVLHSVLVTQSTTETDDSTEIMISRFATVGSGGSTPTANPMDTLDNAFGGVIREADTTDASGAETEIYGEGVSLLAGFHKVWTPEMRPTIPPSGRLVVSTNSTVSSVTLVYTLEFVEFGSA